MNIVLQTPGSGLRVENNNYVMYLLDQKYTIPPDQVKSITIGKGASITSDVIFKAIENETDIIFVDNLGNPQGRIWSPKYGSISNIRIKQIEFVFTSHATQLIKNILMQKIDNYIAVLLYLMSLNPDAEDKIQRTITALRDYKTKIQSVPDDIIPEVSAQIRGWEGLSAKKYFETIAYILPKEFNFTQRGKPPAKDPINAILNYLYGILYSKIEGALIKAGLDPYVGILHRNEYNRPSLVFDVIEVFRHWADYVAFTLALRNSIDNDTFFLVQEDGTFWLDSLGKKIVIQSFNDYLSEIITFNNLQRSREEYIQYYAHQLADHILAFKSSK
jgi:CRISPR-associated protein Cas1